MSMSRHFRKKYDLEEMLREAPDAKHEEIDGKNCWFEWIIQDRRQYQLLYWFDNDYNEYKAAVIQGLKLLNQQLPSSISANGMIDIRSSYSIPCSRVVEARTRVLSILGEVTTMTEPKMRIMTLGFSTAGKTFYLGSLGKLSGNPGSKGFSLQAKDFINLNEIAKLYQIVAGDKEGAISTTVDLRPHFLLLKQGADPVINIEITDIEGQALEPGRNTEIAEKIAKQIGNYDGLILFVEAPKTPRQCEVGKFQLAQMLNFAGEVIKRNKSIPMTLVLTKIDELPRAKEIIPQLKEEVDKFEFNLRKQYNNFGEIRRQSQSQKGSVVNKYVKDFINTMEIFELYDTFFRFLRPTRMEIPNKVFLCTSLGFKTLDGIDNTNLTLESYRQQQIYEPYGSAASFLWTIYASLSSQPRESLAGLVEGMSIDSFKDNLLEEIRELHTSGQAYFTPENGEPQSDIFHLRNISNLRTHQIEA